MQKKFVISESFKAYAYSKTGDSHLTKGNENQDRFCFEYDDHWFYCALADGVSSAPKAGKGADYAIDAVRQVAQSLRTATITNLTVDELRTKIVLTWRGLVQDNFSDYATTINFVIGLREFIIVGRIGDGAIVLRTDVKHILWGSDDLYCAETPALCNKIRREDVNVAIMPRQGATIFYMMSDGIAKEIQTGSEMSLLNYLMNLFDQPQPVVTQELSEWMKCLDQFNADDKTICVIEAGE